MDAPVRIYSSSPPETNRISIGGVIDFWDRINSAKHVSLFLDYDGTLAPFHVDRMLAHPLPGVADAISRIINDHRASVAIVSGRPISEIMALLGNLGTTVVGSHGYEVHSAHGCHREIAVLPEQQAILDGAYASLIADVDPGRVERKVASVAVHVRGLGPCMTADIQDRVERRWRNVGDPALVECRRFNGGLELRAVGRTKGTAVEELLAAAPRFTLPIYVGDDDTDEDVFEVLEGRGIGIRVGPIDTNSRAIGYLTDCESVRQMLIDWPRRYDSR